MAIMSKVCGPNDVSTTLCEREQSISEENLEGASFCYPRRHQHDH